MDTCRCCNLFQPNDEEHWGRRGQHFSLIFQPNNISITMKIRWLDDGTKRTLSTGSMRKSKLKEDKQQVIPDIGLNRVRHLKMQENDKRTCTPDICFTIENFSSAT